MRIKLFHAVTIVLLEEQVNKWIKENNPREFKVEGFQADQRFSMAISYRV